jgi:hypothetical protein
MGTNYYAIKKKTPKQEEYLKEYKSLLLTSVHDEDWDDVITFAESIKDIEDECRVHLGKSSMGWKFLFNHNNWKYYGPDDTSIRKFMESCECIKDEYDEIISISDFWEMVFSKQFGFDIEEHSLDQIEKAKQKEAGTLKDPLNLIMSAAKAQEIYDDYRIHDFYECHEYEGQNIDNLPYRFSQFTEFS